MGGVFLQKVAGVQKQPLVIVARVKSEVEPWLAAANVAGKLFIPKALKLESMRVESDSAGSGTVNINVFSKLGANKGIYTLSLSSATSASTTLTTPHSMLADDYITIDTSIGATAPNGLYIQLTLGA